MLFEGDICEFIAEDVIGEQFKLRGQVKWDYEDLGFYMESCSDIWPHVKFWFINSISKIGNADEIGKII